MSTQFDPIRPKETQHDPRLREPAEGRNPKMTKRNSFTRCVLFLLFADNFPLERSDYSKINTKVEIFFTVPGSHTVLSATACVRHAAISSERAHSLPDRNGGLLPAPF